MSLFNGQAKRVLIVDDEPDICLLLRRLLIKFNLNVDYAYNLSLIHISEPTRPY